MGSNSAISSPEWTRCAVLDEVRQRDVAANALDGRDAEVGGTNGLDGSGNAECTGEVVAIRGLKESREAENHRTQQARHVISPTLVENCWV